MATKTKFTAEMQLASVEFAQLTDKMIAMRAIFFDRQYNVGGNDELLDSDVDTLNTQASRIGDIVTLVENLEGFLESASVAAADRSAVLNRMRTDI